MNTYGDGYQDALQEVLDKWEMDGPDAAMSYIRDNLLVSK